MKSRCSPCSTLSLFRKDGSLSADGRLLDLSHDVFVLKADGSVRYAANGLKPDAAATFLNLNHRKLRIKWDVLHSHGDV